MYAKVRRCITQPNTRNCFTPHVAAPLSASHVKVFCDRLDTTVPDVKHGTHDVRLFTNDAHKRLHTHKRFVCISTNLQRTVTNENDAIRRKNAFVTNVPTTARTHVVTISTAPRKHRTPRVSSFSFLVEQFAPVKCFVFARRVQRSSTTPLPCAAHFLLPCVSRLFAVCSYTPAASVNTDAAHDALQHTANVRFCRRLSVAENSFHKRLRRVFVARLRKVDA